MKNAILEIGVEHLPARFVTPALDQLASKAEAMLRDERLRCKTITTCGTLRRLTLALEGLEKRSDALEKKSLGPSAHLLKNEAGQFTPQAMGFAKAHGVEPQDLEIVESPKGKVLQATKTLPGEPCGKVLARLFPALIRDLQFPKSMEWERSRMRFARPIRNLLALCGPKVVAFELAGVRSSNKAYGDAIGAKPIAIADPAKYVPEMRKRCVLVRAEDRKACLLKGIDQAVKRTKARADLDSALLEEIVYLTEYPVPVVGDFQSEFLVLPQALLSIVLKKQLKFFPVLDAAGKLQPHFVGVRDGESVGQKEIQEGFERVLAARFDDARFFYERDRKTTLEGNLEKLKGVTFQKGLGSLYDKMERVVQNTDWLCEALRKNDLGLNHAAAKRIAQLAYADLATEVVKEFPELQGTMGGHYARADGEPERAAIGVEEFYYPLSAKSPLPATLEGAVASLAGKMDTLAALISAGHLPSGSEDPFALRRAGTGVIRIVLEKQLALDLQEFSKEAFCKIDRIAHASAGARGQSEGKTGEVLELRQFLWQRAENWLGELGYAADEIQAVSENALSDLLRTFKRLAAVHALRPNSEFVTLAGTFKRASNILKQAGNGYSEERVDSGLLDLEGEKSLHEAMARVEGSVRAKIDSEEFEAALKELLALKPFVDRFFDTVRVMDAEESVKRNRLTLLGGLVRLFKSVADISTIQSN